MGFPAGLHKVYSRWRVPAGGDMTDDLQFDVAFSNTGKEDGWVARDLYNLIARRGLSVYCSCHKSSPRAAGILPARLRDIYRDSRLNLLLWSRAYESAARDASSFPAMELSCIVERHISKGDARSLFLLVLDDTPPTHGLERLLRFDIRENGLLGTAPLVLEHIGELSSAWPTDHPPGTGAERGQQHDCEFAVCRNYQDDPLGRWDTLADVLVRVQPRNPLGTPAVYLIPSGACSARLRHSVMLRSDPALLERKRAATEDFVRRNAGSSIRGVWFAMRVGGVDGAEVATVYAPSYDAALNRSLLEDAAAPSCDAAER
jgi:hypothetical protein